MPELTRVMAVHAWAYCPRLFYLEEVEEIRVADQAVYEGRLLHEQVAGEEDGEVCSFSLESESWGLRGRLDAVRRQDGRWLVVEHKKGRSRKTDSGASAWPSDRLQAIAYAVLLEEHLGSRVTAARVRYHEDHRSVLIEADSAAREELREALRQMTRLRDSPARPPVHPEANRCLRCSLAPVCLPEEERLEADPGWEALRLFPAHHDRGTVHVVGHGTRLGRAGDRLVVRPLEGSEESIPVMEVEQVVLHGNVQATSQALALCLSRDIGVHWLTAGGRYLGGTVAGAGGIQRKIRQYTALRDPANALSLAREVAGAKIKSQLRFVLRATRGPEPRKEVVRAGVEVMRRCLRMAPTARDLDTLRGIEGEAGRAYFAALPCLLVPGLPPELQFSGRSRRPPEDAVNALLSFGYALLYRDLVAAIIAVGLEPAFGFFHAPRSAAYPLALDLMELFRVVLVDIPVVGSLNRRQWDFARDFQRLGKAVLLTEAGRDQAISLYEARKADRWRHPVIGYSLSYERLLELEVRLLEKWWCGRPGLFAKWSLR